MLLHFETSEKAASKITSKFLTVWLPVKFRGQIGQMSFQVQLGSFGGAIQWTQKLEGKIGINGWTNYTAAMDADSCSFAECSAVLAVVLWSRDLQ